MKTDLKRALAFKKFNDEDFFDWQGVIYEGTLEDAQEQYESRTEEVGFDDFVKSNFVEVEERDEDEGDYLVCTDDEADDRWEDSLQSYIDDCIMSEIPEYLQRYFDEEKWKQDARYDGRGHSLASYDGEEFEETIEGETFYIYRIN